MTRDEILSEVLEIYRDVEEKQNQINELYLKAKNISDEEDDKNWRDSYLNCIRSYSTFWLTILITNLNNYELCN